MGNWKDTLEEAKTLVEQGHITPAQFTDILYTSLKAMENKTPETISNESAPTDIFHKTAPTKPSLSEKERKLQPGTALGHYQIIELIGSGGMGNVYLARHANEIFAEQTGDVAIKLMNAEYADDEDFRLRFIREAALGRKLNHPNIARVYDLISEDGKLGLAMEYVDGEQINQIIPIGGLGPEIALPLLSSISSAIDHLHEHKIVHRDLKPQNIKLRSNSAPVLMDFGIAKQEEGHNSLITQTGVAMGTVAYMAPEQMDAKNIDGAADRYALGMVTYFMLSGRLPWKKDTSNMRVMAMKFSGEIETLQQANSDINRGTSDIVMKMLSAEPTNRYETGRDFIEALTNSFKRDNQSSAALATQFLQSFQQSSKSNRSNLISDPNLYRPPQKKHKTDPHKISTHSAQQKPPIAIEQSGELNRQTVGESEIIEALLVGGRFWMGNNDHGRDEKPRHVVELTNSYWVMTTPVTQQQYQAIIGENPSSHKEDNHPVGNITWIEALLFCNALSVRCNLKPVYTFNVNRVEANWEAKGYRLPTEAEWEFFAKAGTELKYAGSDDIDLVGWYDNNRSETTSPVSQLKPNAWGLFDMTGNVWEWCWDWYDSKIYPTRSNSVALDPIGADFGVKRVYRGCSCRTKERRARVTYRNKKEPDFRGPYVGFRVIRVV